MAFVTLSLIQVPTVTISKQIFFDYFKYVLPFIAGQFLITFIFKFFFLQRPILKTLFYNFRLTHGNGLLSSPILSVTKSDFKDFLTNPKNTTSCDMLTRTAVLRRGQKSH